MATTLLIIGLLLGAIIYWISNIKGLREDSAYVGGNVIPVEEKVSGVEFYKTIKDMGILKGIYQKAEEKWFDIYDQGANLTFFITRILRRIHSGVLTAYFSWCLLGLIVLLSWLMLVR